MSFAIDIISTSILLHCKSNVVIITAIFFIIYYPKSHTCHHFAAVISISVITALCIRMCIFYMYLYSMHV